MFVKPMIIACDFNGVLHDKAHPIEGKKMGLPMKGAKQAMITLAKQGHTLYIHTDMANTSDGWRAVQEWLQYYHIPYDYITNHKPYGADCFIDDKAIHHVSWRKTMNAIIKIDGSKT